MVFTRRQHGIWNRLVLALRKRCPVVDRQVTVRTCAWLRLKNGLATWDRDGKRARVYVNRFADFDTQIDSLLHEWAHVLSGEADHGRAWSDAYGACYRVFEQLIRDYE